MLSIFDAVRARVGEGVELLDSDLVDDALKIAPRCDVVIAVVGEGILRSGENNCVTTLDLPPGQMAFLEALHALQVPLVVVVLAGRSLSLEWLHHHASAVLMAWHPGTEGAAAITDVLFGDVNPSGRLPVTFPRCVGQVPIYYNQKSTGRPLPRNERRQTRYQDQLDSPLYPFGYGLSYTQFDYKNLHVSQAGPDTVAVSAEITNTGSRSGEETVQLYIRDLAASVTRPVRELKGFTRLALAPGETQMVRFQLTREDLSFYDYAGQWVFEPGDFEVWVAPDSSAGLAGRFVLRSDGA
jgi:beta-glucosidase